MSMGMRLPFDRDRADFSAMTDRREGLCIAAVGHECHLVIPGLVESKKYSDGNDFLFHALLSQ